MLNHVVDLTDRKVVDHLCDLHDEHLSVDVRGLIHLLLNRTEVDLDPM